MQCGFEENLPTPRGSMPISIQQTNVATRYSSVTSASPKQELWPTIGSASPCTSASLLAPEFNVGAWGRAAPPRAAAAAPSKVVACRPLADEDHELRAVGPWALGDLLVDALGQQKQKRGNKTGNAKGSSTSSGDAVDNKKQKKAKGKKMVPLFAVGMNRAPWNHPRCVGFNEIS